jgi:translocation and assembly module TamA
MPTLPINYCPRLCRITLLALVLAQFAAPANADLQIEIRGVAEDIRANVLAYLSFERYKNSDDLSPQFVERLQQRAEREVRGALRPFGYYEPTVASDVKPEGSGGGQDYRIIISITPGKPVMVDKVEVKVSGPGATDQIFTDITNDLPVQPGDTLNHSNYDALKGSLLRAAATYGYLDARMLRNEMRVDPQAYVAQVDIEFETGPRYRFGSTTIRQSTIDDSLVQRYLRYETGQPFDASQLLRTQFALDDSQYFATVEVLPEERDREQLTVPVTISAEPNRRNRYSFGVGYGTDTQVRGTVAWEVRRINQHGHRFRTEIRGSALTQSLNARYIIPVGDPATEKFTLQLTAENERLGDTDNRNFNVIPSLTHLRRSWFGDHWWQRVTYVEFLHTETEFITSGRNEAQTLMIPGISFGLVPSNYLGEALFSRTLYTELRGSHSALGSDSDFLQVRVQAERVFDFAPKWHVLVRGDIGATALSSTSGLSPTQRFFAGGDRSVRGFGVNDLSPVEQVVDENGIPQFNDDGTPKLEKVGGKHLFAATVELIRDLPRNFAIAAFADVGNAFDSFDDPMMYSVGLGVRIRLPVVSVGIDVAQALTIPAGETERPGPRLHLNISPKL